MIVPSLIRHIFRISTGGVKSALLLFCASLLFATEGACGEHAGKISAAMGEIVCRRPGVAGVRTLKNGDTVQVADLLEVGKNGRMQILLSDETVIAAMPGSILRISQYSFERDKSRMSAVVSLKQGTARFILYRERKGGASLKIETEQALIQTSRADAVVVASGPETELFVLAGSASVRNSSNLLVGNVRAGENQSVIVKAKTPPSTPSVIPLQQRRKFIKDARQF